MHLSIQKPKDFFVYLQVEVSAVIFQLFRFSERVHDAVLVETRSTAGNFSDLSDALPILAGYLEQAQRIKDCRVIIGLHSGIFSTSETVITFRREKPAEIIHEVELENVISSALWKVFSRDQEGLARKMRIIESATTLATALIRQIRVDGHRVVSPVGFPAHTLELTILYGATSRTLYDFLAPYIAGEREVYVTEIGMSEVLQLAEEPASDPFLFMRVGELYTYVYRSMTGEARYLDTIVWGRRSLMRVLTSRFMISESQASELWGRVQAGLTSVATRKRIEALLLEEASVLLKGIIMHASQERFQAVYIAAPFSLPEALLSQMHPRRLGVRVPVIPMPADLHGIKKESALTLDMKTLASSVSSLYANAKVAGEFFAVSDINKIAKRRVRWLAGTPTGAAARDGR